MLLSHLVIDISTEAKINKDNNKWYLGRGVQV